MSLVRLLEYPKFVALIDFVLTVISAASFIEPWLPDINTAGAEVSGTRNVSYCVDPLDVKVTRPV